MANFIYENVTLNGAKENLNPLPVDADPNKWLDADEDWNPTIAAMNDIRGAILANLFLGIDTQASAPAVPVGGVNYFLWADSDGDLYWRKHGTGDQRLNEQTPTVSLQAAYNGGVGILMSGAAAPVTMSGAGTLLEFKTAAGVSLAKIRNDSDLYVSILDGAGDYKLLFDPTFFQLWGDYGVSWIYSDQFHTSLINTTATLSADATYGVRLSENNIAKKIFLEINSIEVLKAYKPTGVTATVQALEGIEISFSAGLPAASAIYRNRVITINGGAGVSDTLYQCQKNTLDAYEWVRLDNDNTNVYAATVGTWTEGVLADGGTTATFMQYAPNDAGTTSWYQNVGSFANGGGRRNQVMRIGWNTAAGGGRVTTGALNGGLAEEWEQYFEGYAAVMERHMTYVSPADVQTRYLSFDGRLDTPYTTRLYLTSNLITIGRGTSPSDNDGAFIVSATETRLQSIDGFKRIRAENSAIQMEAGSTSTPVASFTAHAVGDAYVTATRGYFGGVSTGVRFWWDAASAYHQSPDSNSWWYVDNNGLQAAAGGALAYRATSSTTYMKSVNSAASVETNTDGNVYVATTGAAMVLTSTTPVIDATSVVSGIVVRTQGARRFILSDLGGSSIIYGSTDAVYLTLNNAAGALLTHVDERVSVASGAGIVFQTNNIERARFDYSSLRPSVDGTFHLGNYTERWGSVYQGNDGVGITQAIGIGLSNKTDATAGNQKYSPMLVYEGQGWKTDVTAGSQSVRWGIQLTPVEGEAEPSANLMFYQSIAGGAFEGVLRIGRVDGMDETYVTTAAGTFDYLVIGKAVGPQWIMGSVAQLVNPGDGSNCSPIWPGADNQANNALGWFGGRFHSIFVLTVDSYTDTLTLKAGTDKQLNFSTTGFDSNTDNVLTLGTLTKRWSDFATKKGTVLYDAMGTSMAFGRGLLLTGTALGNTYPGSGQVEYSALLEFRQCYGAFIDPESGYNTSRMALQGRTTPNAFSTGADNRLAVLSDNGTGTYAPVLTIFNTGSLAPFVDLTAVLGGYSNRWTGLSLGNDSVEELSTAILTISNKTAAAVGDAKYSPSLNFQSRQWRTDTVTSRVVDGFVQLQAYQAANLSVEFSYLVSDAGGTAKYIGGMGYSNTPYFILMNDTEGSFATLSVDTTGIALYGNHPIAFSSDDTAATDAAFQFSSTDDSIADRFFRLNPPRMTGATTECRDISMGNSQGVGFNATGGITIAHNRQIYFENRTYTATGGAATLTQASTVFIDGAPEQGSGVTIGNAYALYVNLGSIAQKAHASYTGSESVQTTSSVQTTGNTPTTVWSQTLADATLYWVDISVIGRDAAGTERAMYSKRALVYRQGGGGATIQGAVQDVCADVETTGSMDGTITVNSNDVRATVTGIAATTIAWVTTVRIQAVSTNS